MYNKGKHNNIIMRQNIKHNYIQYALLAELLVCSAVFFATPVMAQEVRDITNQQLKESIDNLNNKEDAFGTTEIITTIIGLLIVMGVAFLTKRVWEFPVFVERVNNLVKEFQGLKDDFRKHRHTTEGVASSNSPLHLTQKGREHFENSGCRAYFEKHLQKWMEHFKEFDKDYTIHDEARKFIKEQYEQDNNADFEDIKAYMFNEGVPHDQILLMMSIGLRDMVCKEKGIIIKKKEKVQQ